MSELPGELYRRIQAQAEGLDEYTPRWKYEARLAKIQAQVAKIREALVFVLDRGDCYECVKCGEQFPVFTIHVHAHVD